MKAPFREYLPKDVVFPSQGLSNLPPSTQQDPHFSPILLNIEIVKGLVTKRKGYAPLDSSFSDPIIGVLEFEDFNGLRTLLAITTKKQFRLDLSDPDVPVWINITYQVAAVDVDWTGDESDVLDWTVATGRDQNGQLTRWVLITNGKDQPRYWDGSASKMALFAPNIPNFATCRTFYYFYDHLVLGNVQTSGVYRQALFFSDTQELTDFLGPNAGQIILADAQGAIQKLVPLGDRLVIYADNSLSLMTYIGGTAIYHIDQALQETRLVSLRSIVNIGSFHLFLSQENVTLYDGSRLIRTLGDNIFREYREGLYMPELWRAFAFHDAPKQQVWFNSPVTDAEDVIFKLEYDLLNINNAVWTKFKFPERMVGGMGFFSRESDLRWDSPICVTTAWQDADWNWNQASTREGFPIKVFGVGTQVQYQDDTIADDDGTSIDSFYDTIDFTLPVEHQSSYARWLELELELRGNAVEVWYSPDRSENFTLAEALTLDMVWTKYTIPIDVNANALRIRLVNNALSSFFYFRWIRAWLRSAGPA